MITRRGVLSTLALGASGLVAGAGLFGITPDDATAGAKQHRRRKHRAHRRRNKKQRRRNRRG